MLTLAGCSLSADEEPKRRQLTIVSDFATKNQYIYKPALAMTAAVKSVIEERGHQAGPYRIRQLMGDLAPIPGDERECHFRGNDYGKMRNVIAVVGTDRYACAAYLVPALNRAGIAAISPTEAMPAMTHELPDWRSLGECPFKCSPAEFYPTGVRNYLRTAASHDSEGRAAARLLRSLGSRQPIVVIGIGYLTTEWIGSGFRDEASRLGMQPNDPATYDIRRPVSFGQAARRVVDSEADGVAFFASTIQGGAYQMLRALRRAGFGGPIVGSLSLTEFEQAGPQIPLFSARKEVEGVYFTWNLLPLQALPQTARVFARRLGVEEHAVEAVYAAEATHVLLDAIEASDGTRAGVREALFRVKRNGLVGPISFDANGDVQPQRIAIFRARKGRPVYQRTISLRSG